MNMILHRIKLAWGKPNPSGTAEQIAAKRGFSTNNYIGYAVAGDSKSTYKNKNTIKQQGAKWNPELGLWIFPQQSDIFNTVLVEMLKIFNNNNGMVNTSQVNSDYLSSIKSQAQNMPIMKSQVEKTVVDKPITTNKRLVKNDVGQDTTPVKNDTSVETSGIKRKVSPYFLAKLGFNANQEGYVVIDDVAGSPEKRERIKKEGNGKWFQRAFWLMPQELDGFNTLKITLNDVIDESSDRLHMDKTKIANIKNKLMENNNMEEDNGEYPFIKNKDEKIVQHYSVGDVVRNLDVRYYRSNDFRNVIVCQSFDLDNDLVEWTTNEMSSKFKNRDIKLVKGTVVDVQETLVHGLFVGTELRKYKYVLTDVTFECEGKKYNSIEPNTEDIRNISNNNLQPGDVINNVTVKVKDKEFSYIEATDEKICSGATFIVMEKHIGSNIWLRCDSKKPLPLDNIRRGDVMTLNNVHIISEAMYDGSCFNDRKGAPSVPTNYYIEDDFTIA